MSTDTSALDKTYDPAIAEPEVTARWEATRAFHATAGPDHDDSPYYSVVIPPPNVTAALHLGHALNNTLQDVLVRYHRMRGLRTLWMPGTDHAGIATQTVVEKRLLSQGVNRLDMGRQGFVETTQRWKDEYEAVILGQLKAMGASCDYERTRFTMDEICATAVRHAFFVLFDDDLIYRGKRLVNWDPVTRTALSDDEVEMEEVDGHMWYLRYPLTDGDGHVTVATTRPETMLGDTAVAVNPRDPRAESLRGRSVRLPLVDRIIPIVEDDYVVMPDADGDAKAQFATGFLKVTPAHDPNDWEIGLRHDLPVINVMAADATISDQHGWDDVPDAGRPLVGLTREDARTAIVDWFDENGLLESVRPYSHSVGHSYRSHVPIEPWLSDQWYVRTTDDRLRGAALRAQRPEQTEDLDPQFRADPTKPGDGGLAFAPARYARTFQSWHENIRDWCISRQLWWGHQIPVWNRECALVDATDPVGSAAAELDPGDSARVESRWSNAGAIHVVRRITDTDVVESVCVPPDSTLRRQDRVETTLDETQLVDALEADGYVRDPDVLDTWFSSALWPMSTMGWPYPEDFPETEGLLDAFNPTSMLSTAREIITLWVSRMVMFNRYFLDGRLPFEDVFIHAMVQDGHGQKMSKSLGNGVDPNDIIHSHGADAMRFTLVQMTTDTQDVRMPVDMVCAHTGESFTPEFIVTPAGHTVAAPIQTCPSDPALTMVSGYGLASGLIEPTDKTPRARNTSAKFDNGRNFANKVWNAVRFALGRLDPEAGAGSAIDVTSARFVDRLVVAQLTATTRRLEDALERYQFNAYADTLYSFIWNDVCDRYLEAVKPTIDDDPAQQVVLGAVLDTSLRLMHPVCPFITETLWAQVSAARSGSIVGVELPPSELLATAAWPTIDPAIVDDSVIAEFDRAWNLISQIRTIRASQSVPPRRRVTLHVPSTIEALIESTDGLVETLAGIGTVVPLTDDRPAVASSLAFEGVQILVSGLVDDVDHDAERARLHKLIEEKGRQIAGFEGKLANPGYVNNAKPELVDETRELLEKARADHAAASEALAAL